MEVAPAFLGLPAPQKWPAAAGWEQGWQLGAPAAPRRAHVKSKWKSSTKGLGGGLTAHRVPPGGLHKQGPQRRRPAGAGRPSFPTFQEPHKGTSETPLAVK